MTVPRALSEPLAHSPLVLSKQYATELGEAVGWNMFGCRRGRAADGEGHLGRAGLWRPFFLPLRGRDWVAGSAVHPTRRSVSCCPDRGTPVSQAVLGREPFPSVGVRP